MEKENIFSKLNSKDYNNQLEKILENKDFSENVKNLLLSMLYKIEAGYQDYLIVKRIVENKRNYIEEILEIIKNKCKKIIIVEENSEKSKEMEELGTKFLVDKLEGSIFLMYPNERLLLYTIYKIDDTQIYLDEKYNLIRNTLSELLNAGENMNNIEVLRDFNGWNWNTEIKEIPEITTNAVYQNLIYLLGIEFIKQWVHTQKVVDYVELVEKKLIEDYGEEYTEEILKNIYKISISICTTKNSREKQRLIEEKIVLQEEFDRLENKKSLLNEISIFKKEALKKIKEIDTILSDKKILEEEYVKRNEKRPEYNKIFNISHLTEIIGKERKKLLAKIEENNQLLDPKYYVPKKQQLQKQLELLEDINLGYLPKEEKKMAYMINLQKQFMKCFMIQIEKAQEKEEIIQLFYMLRYYYSIYITKNLPIKDVPILQDERNEVEKLLLKKAYTLKVLVRITEEETTNDEIIKNLFYTKIIGLNNVNIELKQNETALEVSFYDGDIYDKTIQIPIFQRKQMNVKLNKRIKVFL